MKNFRLFTTTTVFSLAIASVLSTMSVVSAYQNSEGKRVKYTTQAQAEEIHEALYNEDYEAWLELIENNKKLSKMTEAEFLEYAEKELKKVEEMEARREELEEKREALEEALENLDYEVWYEIMKENERNEELLEIISEDNFVRFVEMHDLKKEARELAKELGIENLCTENFGRGKQDKKNNKRMF